jgi:cytochrome c-type biogenesis protein CcmH
MMFWVIIGAMAVLVTALLSQAVLRARAQDVAGAAEFDLRVYRDQLAEVDRDVARGVLPEEDAERVRTEISRRILASDAASRGTTHASSAPQTPILLALAVVLLGGSLALYLQIGAPGYGDLALEDRKAMAQQMRESRPSQQAAQDSLAPFAAPEMAPEMAALLTRLREVVGERPDDVQGQIFLAQYEARIGNFTAAVAAQDAVLRIKSDTATADDIADYGELLVYAAGGYVSPEAERAFRAALAQDAEDGRSLYYIGLMMSQTGRPDIAFQLWDRLLRQGPPEASWIEPIQAQIMPLSVRAGVNYTMPTIGDGAMRGPTAEDIEAAADMTAEERMAMVSGMIEGLANRLATQGGPPQDWARLITSLAVTGQPDQALAVFTNAMEVFADDPGALDIIRTAGSDAGVVE